MSRPIILSLSKGGGRVSHEERGPRRSVGSYFDKLSTSGPYRPRFSATMTLAMQAHADASAATPQPARRLRPVVLYLASVSPVLLLIALLAWGQVRSGGAPGGVLVHNEAGEAPVVERAAPLLSGADALSGAPVDLQLMGGKVRVVYFWSSWCVACRLEAEDLAAVYRTYAGQPVEFVGVAVWDEQGNVLRHLERFDVPYPNVIDELGMATVSYGATGVPEKFFIDRQGRIVRKLIGPTSTEKITSILDELLGL